MNQIIQFNGPTRVEWFDPTATSKYTMASVQTQKKQLGTHALTQVNALVVSQMSAPLPKPSGCTDACLVMPEEKLSIRTTTSGSRENAAAVLVLLESHINALNALYGEYGMEIGIIKRDAVIPSPVYPPVP